MAPFRWSLLDPYRVAGMVFLHRPNCSLEIVLSARPRERVRENTHLPLFRFVPLVRDSVSAAPHVVAISGGLQRVGQSLWGDGEKDHLGLAYLKALSGGRPLMAVHGSTVMP